MTDAGIFAEQDHVRRIVIDIDARAIPVIHLERFGDERLLTVVTSLEGVKIMEPEPVTEQVTETRGGESPADLVVAPVPPQVPAVAHAYTAGCAGHHALSAPCPLGANDPDTQ